MATTTQTYGNLTAEQKTFYDRTLLSRLLPNLTFLKYGQKRPIPKNSGKRVEFRKWNLFDANDAMEALQEGVTPASQALSQSNVEVEVAQYGAYVEVSDLLDMTHGHTYDPVCESQGLGLVVGYVKHGGLKSLVQEEDLPSCRAPELGIKV